MLTFPGRLFAALVAYARHLHRRHEQLRAQRVLESLPDYLLKDIGWPDRQFERDSRVPRCAILDAEAMLARTECPSVFGLDRAVASRNGL